MPGPVVGTGEATLMKTDPSYVKLNGGGRQIVIHKCTLKMLGGSSAVRKCGQLDMECLRGSSVEEGLC